MLLSLSAGPLRLFCLAVGCWGFGVGFEGVGGGVLVGLFQVFLIALRIIQFCLHSIPIFYLIKRESFGLYYTSNSSLGSPSSSLGHSLITLRPLHNFIDLKHSLTAVSLQVEPLQCQAAVLGITSRILMAGAAGCPVWDKDTGCPVPVPASSELPTGSLRTGSNLRPCCRVYLKMAMAALGKAPFFCALATSEHKAKITGTYDTPAVSTKMHRRAYNHSANKDSNQKLRESFIIVFIKHLDCTMESELHLSYAQCIGKWSN